MDFYSMTSKKGIAIFLPFFILWMFPFLVTAFFNHPAIDDYWNANAVKMYGRLGAVQHFCRTVSGRYTSLSIMSLCNTLPNGKVWIFKIWPVLIMLLLYFSIYFLYSSIFFRKEDQPKVIMLSCLFLMAHIAGMRSLFEGLYWMSSTVCYGTAICLFVTGIGAIIKEARKAKYSNRIVAVTASLLLPGSVEIIIPVYFFTLTLLLYVFYKLNYNKSLLYFCLLITLCLAFVVLLNQGNLLRVNHNSLTYKVSLWEAVKDSILSEGYYTILYILNPLFICIFLSVKLLFHLKTKLSLTLSKADYVLVICYFAVSGFAVYLPLHFLESSVPFPRVTTLFFFLFFHACCFLVFFDSGILTRILFKYESYFKGRITQTVLAIVFFVSAFTNRNYTLICKDLFDGTAVKYNRESYARYDLIRHCSTDTCFVPLHKYWPYFAQSSKKESSEAPQFEHMNFYFEKTIVIK